MQHKSILFFILAFAMTGCDFLSLRTKTISGIFVARIENDTFIQLDTLLIVREPAPPKNQFSVVQKGYTRYHEPSPLAEDAPHKRTFQGEYDENARRFNSANGIVSLSFDSDLNAVRFGEFVYKRIE